MSREIKNIIMEKYGRIFSQYFSNFSQNNFDFKGDLKGNIMIKLENIDLRRDCLLTAANYPLIIEEGSIAELTIQFNILSLIKIETTDVSIKNIKLHLNSLSETYKSKFLKDMNKAKKEEIGGNEQENYKQQKLKEWEDKVKKQFKALTPDSWFANLAINMANNLKIRVENFSLFYQNYSILETETILKISFNSLEILSTNEKGKPDITHASDSIHFKKFKIQGFGVSLVTTSDFKVKEDLKFKKPTPLINTPKSTTIIINTSNNLNSEKQNNTFQSSSLRKKPGIHMDYLRQEYTEKTYKCLKEIKNPVFLIRPINVRLKIMVDKKVEDPKIHLWLSFKHPVIVILNKQQREYLSNLEKHIKSLEIIRLNLHLRPTVLFRNNRLEWFRYAVKAIIEQNKKLKLNFKKSTQKLTLQTKYISLYKKKQSIIHTNWMGQWTSKDEENFILCERELEVKDLLRFRKMAFQEIKRDFKEYTKKEKELFGSSNEIPITNQLKSKPPEKKEKPPTESPRKPQIKRNTKLGTSGSGSSFLIEDEEELSLNKTSIIFEASLQKFLVFLTNNSTSMPNKYIPANIKLYRDCDCAKCCPSRYDKKKMPTNDSFYSIPSDNNDFKSVGSEKSSNAEEEELIRTRKNTIESLRSIRKIILFVELIGLDFKISYMDNTISHLDDIPLKIWNISIIDPYSLQRFYREAEEEKRFGEEISENTKNYKERFRYFYGYLFDKYKEEILVTTEKKKKDEEMKEKEKENNEEISEKTKKKNSAEFVKRKNQKKFTFLIHFLLFNGNLSLSEFLICLRKDKKNYDELNLDGLDKYNKFFEVDSKFFLHFNEETKAKYLKIKSSNSKKKIFSFLESVDQGFIKEILLKYYFGYFLEDYDLVELKDSIDRNIKKKQSTLEGIPLKGFKTQNDMEIKFKLKKVSFQNEENLEKNHDMTINDILKKTMKVSFAKVMIGSPMIFLSMNSIQNLYFYLKSDEMNLEKPKSASTIEKEKLLKSILKSWRYDESVKMKLKTKKYINYDITIQGLYLHIENCSSLYKNFNQILLQIEGISFRSLISLDSLYDEKNKDNLPVYYKPSSIEDVKTYEAEQHFNRKLELYKIFAFSIEKISIVQSLEFSTPARTKTKTQKEILKSSIYAIISSLISQNTINKIDKKVTIGVPFIQIDLSDDMFPFFELLESFRIIASELEELKKGQRSKQQNGRNKYLETVLKSTAKIKENAKNVNNNSQENKDKSLPEFPMKPNNAKQGVTDDILIMEFQNLMEEHMEISRSKPNEKEKDKEKEKRECNHCSLKIKQSNLLLNVVFGDLTHYFNDYSKTDFLLLDKWMSRTTDLKRKKLESETGIKILFKTSQRSTSSCCTQIHLPIIIVTFDQGFFKNNISIHSAKATNQGKDKEDNLTTNVILRPFLDVDENILTSLEEGFYKYCLLLDERIPTYLNKKENENKDFNDNQIFLVCYRKHINLRDLLETYDKDFEKSRNIFFLKLREIGAIFQDSSSMIPLINLLRNIDSFNKIFSKYLKSELAYMFLTPEDYEIASENLHRGSTIYTFESNGPQSKKLEETSGLKIIKELEKETIFFSIEKFYLQFLNMFLDNQFVMSASMGKPQSIVFQIHNFKLFLTAVTVFEIKSLFSIENVRLSFSSNMQFTLERLNLSKKDDNFIFELKSIKMVTGKNQNVIMIPEKPSLDLEPESNSNQEINKESPYLSFPTRRAVSEGFNSSPNKPPTSAVKIVIKVSNEKIEKVRVAIEAIWIEVSMRMINELTEVLNVPIELSNLEHKEFKKFLKNSILQEGFKEIAGNFNHLFESMFPVNKESTYTTLRNSAALKRTNSNRNENLVKNFELTLSMSRLTVRLLETKLDFLVVFDEILVEMIKSQIEASIYGFSLKPYPEKSYIYKDLINKMEGDNKEFPLVRIVRDKRSHNIEIFLNRMQFIVVNRYMEELIGFKNQVASKFNDLKKQLISKVKIEKEVEELNSLESSQRHKPVLLIIHGSDLQIVIPQHSSSLDAITLLIKSVKITRNSDRISANFPDFNSSSPSIVQKIDNKLLVFEPDTINPQEVPVDIFDIELNDLDAYFNYSFMKKSPLLFAKKLKLIITKPIDALHAYDSNEKWRFKDMVEIEDIEDLKMDLNMGAIDIALSIFKDNNREEDKEIYEFLKDVYEKIMMELDIEEIDIEIETLEVQPGALKKESIIIVEKREEEGELE